MTDKSIGPGTVLAGRFRLEDLVQEAAGAKFWRATDLTLARSVAVNVVDAADPRADALLQAARTSATVTDGHFLRVLDAAEEEGVVYVVNEWGSGVSLDRMLGDGPLPARRAAWLVKEVADAITTAHRHGVAHGRLLPENVMVTEAGSVKLIGFVVDAVLSGRHLPQADGEPMSDHESDVVNLAALLYATLVGRWPGSAGSHLPDAPREHGRTLRPRQVRAGVPRPLDAICDRVLNAQAHQQAMPIETAHEIGAALSDFIGDPTGMHVGYEPTAVLDRDQLRRAAATRGSAAAGSPAAGHPDSGDAASDADATPVAPLEEPHAADPAPAEPPDGADETSPARATTEQATPEQTPAEQTTWERAGQSATSQDPTSQDPTSEDTTLQDRTGVSDGDTALTLAQPGPTGTPAAPTGARDAPDPEATQVGTPLFFDDDTGVGWVSPGESRGLRSDEEPIRRASPPPPPPFPELEPRPLFAPDPPGHRTRRDPADEPVVPRRGLGPQDSAPVTPTGNAPGDSATGWNAQQTAPPPGATAGQPPEGAAGHGPRRSTGHTNHGTGSLPPVWGPDAAPPGDAGDGEGQETRDAGKSWLQLAGIVAGCLVLLVAVIIAFNLGRGSQQSDTATGSTPSPSGAESQRPAKPVQVAGVSDFDPQGDPPDENPDLAPLAIDGDPSTAWASLTYKGNPKLGLLKDGVGLVVDLGKPVEVAEVDLTLIGRPTSLDILAADQGAGTPTSVDGLTRVATAQDAGPQLDLKLEDPVTTRYLVVWLTSLPPVSDGYKGQVAEIVVRS